ncbi:hypothetical protein LINGRAPRIM_LOCUS850 [Linum grandiflorum]
MLCCEDRTKAEEDNGGKTKAKGEGKEKGEGKQKGEGNQKWITKGMVLAEGLSSICNDFDVQLLANAANEGVVTVYMEGTGYEPIVTGERSHMRENDSDEPSDWDDGYRNESDADVSAVPAHVGVNEVVPRHHNQEQEVIVMDEGGVNDMDGMHLHNSNSDADDEDSDYDVDKEMACDSTEEDNDADNSEDVHFDDVEEELVDGDEVNSLRGEPYYDPECDHSKLVLKEKLASPNQFNEAIANYTIAVGADIK